MNTSAPLVGSPDRVTREAMGVGLMGWERGGGVFMTLYLHCLYCLVWSQRFFRRLIQTCMVTGCQPLSTPCAVDPGRTLRRVRAGPIGSPPTCSLLFSLT